MHWILLTDSKISGLKGALSKCGYCKAILLSLLSGKYEGDADLTI